MMNKEFSFEVYKNLWMYKKIWCENDERDLKKHFAD